MDFMNSGSAWTEHNLTAGTLHLRMDTPGGDGLFQIAERINPKRAFLFVSTVLGRHIPVAPKDHRAALTDLAARVAPHLLSGPALVMGYAETAVGLGAGVHQCLRRMMPFKQMGYLATTRFVPSEHDVWFRIEEPHSHASDHAILKPRSGVIQDGAASTLVLVDDETTTGTTFRNLVSSLAAQGLRFGRVVLVTLTDWSEGSATKGVLGAMPDADVVAVSLAQGAWRWEQDTSRPAQKLPAGVPAACPAWAPRGNAPLEVARRGIATGAKSSLSRSQMNHIAMQCGLHGLSEGARVLVLGSGENVWSPFLFAEELEGAGFDVAFLATTRSPVALGNAVKSKITFPDHYGLGLNMYLHNADTLCPDAVVLFNETGVPGTHSDLIDALGRVHVVDAFGRTRAISAKEEAAA